MARRRQAPVSAVDSDCLAHGRLAVADPTWPANLRRATAVKLNQPLEIEETLPLRAAAVHLVRTVLLEGRGRNVRPLRECRGTPSCAVETAAMNDETGMV